MKEKKTRNNEVISALIKAVTGSASSQEYWGRGLRRLGHVAGGAILGVHCGSARGLFGCDA